MLGTVNVYIIWYGTWTSVQKVIVRDFFGNLSNSEWLNIQTTYYQWSPSAGTQYVSASVQLAGEIDDQYSYGQNFNATDITPVVGRALNNNLLPADENGVYFVAVSADCNFPGMCTSFCGYHTAFDWYGTRIKEAMVGGHTCCVCAGR